MLFDDYLQDADMRSVLMQDPGFLAYSGLEAFASNDGLIPARVRTAQKFVLSPHVVEACWDIADRGKGKDVMTSRDYLFTPARRTWIEWTEQRDLGVRSRRFALYMDGGDEDDTTGLFIGSGYCVFDLSYGVGGDIGLAPITYDFPGTGTLLSGLRQKFAQDPVVMAELGNRGVTDSENFLSAMSCDLDKISLFVGAALALINTPRLTQVVDHDLSKLNRARLKRDKPPLLSYKDVIIRPDSGWTSESEARRETGEVRRHHVRTFLRLKQGKVELVRPHWRGNREKGYVLQNHVVRMTDEEAGSWKGPPHIGDKIIGPGVMDGLTDDDVAP